MCKLKDDKDVQKYCRSILYHPCICSSGIDNAYKICKASKTGHDCICDIKEV